MKLLALFVAAIVVTGILAGPGAGGPEASCMGVCHAPLVVPPLRQMGEPTLAPEPLPKRCTRTEIVDVTIEVDSTGALAVD